MKNLSKLVVAIVILMVVLVAGVSAAQVKSNSGVVVTAKVVVLSADVKIDTKMYVQLKEKDLDDAMYTDKYNNYTVYMQVVGNKAKYYVRKAVDGYDPMTGIAIIDGVENEKCTLEPGYNDPNHLYWTNVATGVQYAPAVECTNK